MSLRCRAGPLRWACFFFLFAGSARALARDRLTTYSWDEALFDSGVSSALITFMAAGNDRWAKMEAAWIEIAEELQEESTILVATVDCAEEHSKTLCEKRHNITKYPTINFYMPPDPVGEQFDGDQTLAALRNFTKELLSGCYPADKKGCSAEQLLELERMEKHGIAKVRRRLWNLKRKFAKSEDALRERLEKKHQSVATMTPEERKAHAAMEQQRLLMSIVQRDQAIGMSKSDKFRLMKAFLAPHGGVGEDHGESKTTGGKGKPGKRKAPKGKASAAAVAKAEALARGIAKSAGQKDEV